MNLVFLHGSAASGKLTTARALETELGYPVFHNHLVVDMLMTVFPFGSAAFVDLREQTWLGVFEAAASAGRSLIFTFAPEATVVSGFPARVADAVEAHGGRVCFVRLLVGEQEQERRIVAADRREFRKLADVETLRRIRTTSDLSQLEQPPYDLEIDTEHSRPDESAQAIIEHFELTAQRLDKGYPN